jgi:hypothetical protein
VSRLDYEFSTYRIAPEKVSSSISLQGHDGSQLPLIGEQVPPVSIDYQP